MLTMIAVPNVRQVRQVVLDEGLDAVVVQADRVEHAAGRFDGSPGAIAVPRLAGDRLGQDPAQAGQIDQAGHLAGIAERARGHHDRVGEPQPAELDGEVDGRRVHVALGRR